MKKFHILLWLGALLFVASIAWGQPQARHADLKSASAFVQNFYDWYIPKAFAHDNPLPADAIAIYKKQSQFSLQLVKALRKDQVAPASSPGFTIKGLGFDPFLAAQEPCMHYVAGTARKSGDKYYVDVFGICQGRKHEQPDVTTELVRYQGSWIFVNFYYPDNSDLLTILKQLRKEGKRK